MLPKFLSVTTSETFIVNSMTIEIPKCIVTFDKWTGEGVKETFGGKAILSIDKKPMFAELAILLHFIKEGWDARWIQTYGRKGKEPIHLRDWKDDKYKNQIHDPIKDKNILNLLMRISKENADSYAGCWDIIAWKNEDIIFAESKRTKKDSIRSTQTKWLNAGWKCGLDESNFLVVEWDMKAES